ncbi:MBL fold metallo-hydrolase [Streptomyces sp. WAC 01325]|uniref:MBL fold metallo-hydrolase n=1 Tax=Streptomyces sp. WAC 01325 TaxID=2203202 RepID=UPI00163B7B76|nr:MBL fold metallo-hydrolase [Streptomyces sp. WAC 01325]
MTAGGAQAAFLVTGAGVVVIDAPPSLAEALPAAIRRVTGRKVTRLVYGHDHADHTAGASAFGDVVRIAHTETVERIRTAKDPGRPMATVTSGDRYRLDLGGQRLLLSHPGATHEAWAAVRLGHRRQRPRRTAGPPTTGKAVADKVEPVMYRKWLGRLGAVDVFTRENALIVALSHIVDAPRDL